MPYVAKEIYHADQTTLGYLVASAACGALLGSITLSRYGSRPPAGSHDGDLRGRLVHDALVFAHTNHLAAGIPVLILAGFSHSLGQIPMAATLLRNVGEQLPRTHHGDHGCWRIYGNLPGLWIAGPLIASFGYPFTATLYCLIGIGSIVLITARWRAQIWRLTAPANKR